MMRPMSHQPHILQGGTTHLRLWKRKMRDRDYRDGNRGGTQNTRDAPYEDSQHQNSRQQLQQRRDEVISVYEIYVKDEEETVNPSCTDGKNLSSIIPAASSSSSTAATAAAAGVSSSVNELIQADCVVELDETLESELIGPADTAVSVEKFRDKDSTIKINIDEKLLPYSHPGSRVQPPAAATRLQVDKDDPRSRLHFVKYMKRDGKTLKIWECGICSKEFRHQYTLMRHLPTHTDERNFKCETCGKAFRQLSTLSQHRAIHSDARPYVCEYCKKTFNRVSTLISHRKTHSDDKPHKCHMCGKGFHQKGNLRNHVFTHTNERPYKCGLCGKGFNQMSNLMCHKMKSHANVERSLPYGCTICGKKFLRRFALRSHEEHKHGIKYPEAKTNAILDSELDPKNPDIGVADLQNQNRTQDPVIIDAIRTSAMEDVLSSGQTPFALFKPSKGIPILVKVSPASMNGDGKQILNPATAEDIKFSGKMCLGTATLINEPNGLKAVQIKVPVVATVTQRLDTLGNFTYIIETSESDQDQGIQMVETQFAYSELELDQSPRVVTVNQNLEAIAKEANDFNQFPNDDGDVQYIRATEDGRYEMMSNTEAIDLMAQNSHDVTILNDVEVASMNFEDRVTVRDKSLNSAAAVISHKNIEVFGDKDFRILGSREDRFSVEDNISLLEQSRIEDFILGSRGVNSDIVIDGDTDTAEVCGFSPVIDSAFRNHVDPNELQMFNRRQSLFLNQLQNLG